MATEKEKEKVRELVEIAMGINERKDIFCAVDVRDFGIEMRIAPRPFEREWIFYSDRPAYFPDDTFSIDDFISRMDSYIAEAKKHHKSFDADGVKL